MISFILGYIVLVLFSMMLMYVRKIKGCSFYTILSFLIFPVLIVTGVQVILCIIMNLRKPPFEYWIVYMVFFFVAFLFDLMGENFANRVSLGSIKLKKNVATIDTHRYYRKRLSFLAVIGVIYAIMHLVIIMSHYPSFYQLVQSEVQEQYSSGLNYYVRLFLMLCTVYYWGCAKFTKNNIIMGLICFVPNMLTFVKSILLLSILGALVIRLYKGEIKLSLRTCIITLSLGVIVFFGINLIEVGIYDTEVLKNVETYKSIGAKMGGYFISGVQSFGQNLLDGVHSFRKVDNVTIAPFVSLLSKFGIGTSFRAITTIDQVFWYSSQLGKTFASNVNGYVGTLYLFSGVLFGNILNALWVFIASFMKTLFTDTMDMMTALAGLFCSAFLLGWFDYYFSQTFWIYLIMIAAIANYFLKLNFSR